MRFSAKKVLAFVVCVAVVLSTFVGALSVSATDAAVVGSVTLADTTADFSVGTFTTTATVSLNAPKEYVEAYFQLGTLPSGVTFTGATSSDASVVVDTAKRVIALSAASVSSSITATLSFTISGNVGNFTLSTNAVYYADATDDDATLDITDTAAVVIHGPSSNMASDSTGHYYTCVASGCTTKYNLTAHTAAAAVTENNVAATCTTAGSYDSVVYCSVCGYEISRTNNNVPATGHTPAAAVVENEVAATCGTAGSYDSVVYCSVCNAEISRTQNVIPATGAHSYIYTDNGDGTHTVTCANCSYSSTEEHSYTDGTCVCGATEAPSVVTDNTLVFYSASLGFGTSSLQIAFRIDNTVLAKYADVKVVIIPGKYSTTDLNLVEVPDEIVVNKTDLVAAGTKRKQYYYTDIQLYELGLDINYMLRGYDALGNLVAVSQTFTTSPATYLKSSIAASSDAKFKKVATDALIVCDEVMKNVAASYPSSDLAKATSVIAGFDTSNASDSVGEYNTVNSFNSYSSEYTTASAAVHQIRTSVQIGKVPFINFRIGDSKKALDLNKLVVNVTYTSVNSTGPQVYNKNFTGTSAFTYAGKYINLTFDEVGLHDSDKDIVFTVIYDGVTVCDLTYSIETYEGANQTSATGPVVVALLKLGQSFRAYQGL